MRVPVSLLSILLITLTCYACNHQNKTPDTVTNEMVNSSGSSATGDYARGAKLLTANDCLTCHSIDKKMVGPSFAQIASRYHNEAKYATYLSNSVTQGSVGVWGKAVMTPHANVPYNDVRDMVLYILSVKDKPADAQLR